MLPYPNGIKDQAVTHLTNNQKQDQQQGWAPKQCVPSVIPCSELDIIPRGTIKSMYSV